MESQPNDQSIASESAPLLAPSDGDDNLFMVPLKRPMPGKSSRLSSVPPQSPPGSPSVTSPQSNVKSPQSGRIFGVSPYQSPAFSGRTVKPESPPMFVSPLMSPDSGMGGCPNLLCMATPESLLYSSPPMPGRTAGAGSSANISSQNNSASGSPDPQASSKGNTTSTARSAVGDGKPTEPSTKATSVGDSPPLANVEKPGEEVAAVTTQDMPAKPPAISAARNLRAHRPAPAVNASSRNLGLALNLGGNHPSTNPNFLTLPTSRAPKSPLAPPEATTSPISPHDSAAGKRSKGTGWTVPDSPLERLSQLRATPDSAYDRARQMELRRSEWKHVMYRFPMRGKEDWVIDADLTESSHARLADVARRSSEGFKWNGDRELANIYRVLAAAHTKVMEEMRAERRAMTAGVS
ncbi:hypothetical protein VTJ83DRAFT_6952 [Remersonia thermophila]|uniref:Uncharacterized protein n=1 Tax=Remersonia thermophila TaxID=72144 RepID=A0ABR4D653_9PEZI